MSTPCAACKYLRKKCQQDCPFAPYFPANKYEKYEAVHKVFGASHVSRLLNEIHPSQREEAMHALTVEAEVRLRDPINGFTALIYPLQRKLNDLQARLAIEKNELASYNIIQYQQNNHHNPMMMPTMPNYGRHFTNQQLQLSQEEAQWSENEAQPFAFAQRQQNQETQTKHK